MDKEKEIQPKQRYTGTVLKTTLQGALVDIGSEKPAFIHISQAVKDGDPKIAINSIDEVLEVGQEVEFWVKRVKKDRIELTMKEPLALEWREIKPEMTVKGTVVRLESFGAFVDIGAERPGLIHISELSHSYVRTPGEVVREGDEIEAKVLEINRRKKQIKLSIKALQVLPENLQMSGARGGQDKQEETPQEPDLTAMEIAMRQAMERAESDEEPPKKKAKRAKNESPEQDDIISRTLDNKVNENS